MSSIPEKALAAVYGSVAEDWHQHSNGGGWVYKNAKVEESAYVHPTSIVYGDARVSGYAWQTSPPYLQGTRHALTLCSQTQIAIGCHVRDIADWQKHYKAIGKLEGYREEQIAEYGEHIAYLAKLATRLKPEKKSELSDEVKA